MLYQLSYLPTRSRLRRSHPTDARATQGADQGGGLSSRARRASTSEELPRAGDVALDLPGQLLDVREALLGAQPRQEVELQVGAVEVALEVEQVGRIAASSSVLLSAIIHWMAW